MDNAKDLAKMSPDALYTIATHLCQQFDQSPHGTDITFLRMAMREFAWAGHLGCRNRLDSVSCVGEAE